MVDLIVALAAVLSIAAVTFKESGSETGKMAFLGAGTFALFILVARHNERERNAPPRLSLPIPDGTHHLAGGGGVLTLKKGGAALQFFYRDTPLVLAPPNPQGGRCRDAVYILTSFWGASRKKKGEGEVKAEKTASSVSWTWTHYPEVMDSGPEAIYFDPENFVVVADLAQRQLRVFQDGTIRSRW